jgi:hypothetical protein
MNPTAWILSLATGLVGWLLNELSHRRREVAGDRRAVSRALADLLEIRHQTVGLKALLDEVTKHFQLPANVMSLVLPYVHQFWPNTDDLSRRYNEAVNAVAAADPFLGFQLRSKDEVTRLLKTLQQLSSQDQKATQLWAELQAILLDLIKSPLDDIILDLAKQHGRRTSKSIRKYLAEPIAESKELKEYFAKVESILTAAGQPSGQRLNDRA